MDNDIIIEPTLDEYLDEYKRSIDHDPSMGHVIVRQLMSGYEMPHVGSRVFALMTEIADDAGLERSSDLYHDALFLHRTLDEAGLGATEVRLWYTITEQSTFLTTDWDLYHSFAARYRTKADQQDWELIITIDERQRSYVTAVRLDVTPNARFHSCDICDERVDAPYESTTTRPSDPSSRACVIARCEHCGRNDATGQPYTDDLYEVQAQRVEAGFFRGVYFYE